LRRQVVAGSGPAPLVSNLNFSAGETVPNLVTVAGGNGQVSFYNDSPGATHLVVDEYGYYIPASLPGRESSR
jgi:hypothetical protein